MKQKRITRSFYGNAITMLFLLIMGAFTALPFYLSIINAFKPIEEIFMFPPRFIVLNPTVSNFLQIFTTQAQALVPMERYIFNTVFITVVGTLVYVLIAGMAAYPLSKHNFKGKKILHKVIIYAIMFRPEVTGLPQYIMMSRVGMIDTYWSLLLPTLGGSFGVFLMMQFMESFPDNVLEAARIDGCSERGIFFRIIFPSVRPAWLTLIIFTMLGYWNNTGASFIFSEDLKTIHTMAAQISSASISRAGMAAAFSLLSMIPPIVVFLFSQRSVVETMASSGIKE